MSRKRNIKKEMFGDRNPIALIWGVIESSTLLNNLT